MFAFFGTLHTLLGRMLGAVLVVMLCPSLAMAACSSLYRGTIVFNEVQIPNGGTNYIELRVLNPSIVAATNSFTGWTISANRKAKSGGAVTSTTVNLNSAVTNTSLNTCGASSAWIQIPDSVLGNYLATARNNSNDDLNFVLYDSSGNMVDLLRMADGTLSSFYSGAGSQCSAIEPSSASTFNDKYDIKWGSGSSIKDWFRTFDGTGNWTGTDTANNSNSICGSNDVAAAAQVGLNKVASASTVNTNTNFSYTLFASNPNTGVARTNVVVTDPLPSGVSFVSCSATAPDTCTNSAGTVTWTISSLPINTTRSATLTVSATTTGTKTNTITATTSGTATASATVTVSATAPVVTTVAASSVVATTATLNGTVDPKNLTTAVSFNYGPYSGSYTSSCTPGSSSFSGSTTQSFTCAISGLSCGTTYYFQATGTNSSSVTSKGVELNFTTSSCGGSFDAYETSFTSAQAIAGAAKIKTHVASGSGLCVNGGACNLTIGVFNSGALQTSFTGPVKLEIVDGSTGAGVCANYTAIATWVGSQTLSATGETTVNLPAVANTYANARIRISYPASGTATSQSCSSDNFAIRPERFASVSVKDATWTTAGSTNTLSNKILTAATPIHKAGRPFSLNATAVNVSAATTSNYAGAPVAVLSACSGGTACVATPGTLAVGVSFTSGVLASTAATYSDVGAFSMVLQDTSFADVDASDSTTAERYITSTAQDVGRFVPDHFVLSLGALVNRSDLCPAGSGCPSSFTYMGESMKTSFTLTAENGFSSPTPTVNYAGLLGRLDPATADWLAIGSNSSLGLGVVNVTAPTPTNTALSSRLAMSATPPSVTWTAGIATITAEFSLSRPSTTTPDATWGPYEFLNIGVAPQDADGVVLQTAALNLDADVNTSLERTLVGTSKLRMGRMFTPNMYGSERLPLPIPITVQYYNGTDWRTSLTDNTTSFSSKVFTASGNLVADNTNCAVVTTPDTAPVAVSSGVRTLIFSRFPVTPPAPTCITIFSINAPTYLPNAGGGSATFGIYKSPLIYRRENY